MNSRIIIAGGGTGGHIYPAIGIAKELQLLDPNIDIVFIGGATQLESKIVPQNGFQFLPISVVGFPRKLTLKWFSVMTKLFLGIVKSLQILAELQPNAVVGTGGYVSGPVLVAAWIHRIPSFLQEQNASPGITNRIAGTWVRMAYLALETAVSYFPSGAVMLTGNPIRRSISTVKRSLGNYGKFGLDPDLKTVFVMGGSQGATAINSLIIDALGYLECHNQNFQLIHQTGEQDLQVVMNKYDESSVKSLIKPYFDRIEEIYSIVDLMVCRSGGMTVSEITACGIPSIFIPLPSAVGNDQLANAKMIASKGAGIVLDQFKIDGKTLANYIINIVTDPARLDSMSKASHRLGNSEAGRIIAESIYDLM